MNEPAYLIVNADDYGYFASVSRGILDGGKDGVITATGIMANSLHFDEHIGWLKDAPYLDVGVHLNLTCGRPLTEKMARQLVRGQGAFPGKYSLVFGILSRQLPLKAIEEECRAQIARCRDAGLELRFLNSHEHIHALPPLFTAVVKLAREYNIPYIRRPEPEWDSWSGMGSFLRNSILQGIHPINRARVPSGTPQLLGMNNSGKLTLAYLQKRLASLKRGQVYELMCHPGYFDPGEIRDRRLCSYHHWHEELDLLKSRGVRDLCNSLGIQITRYTAVKESGAGTKKHSELKK